MKTYQFITFFIAVIALSSCGDGNNESSEQKSSTEGSTGLQVAQENSKDNIPVIGSSFTKKILIETNEAIRNSKKSFTPELTSAEVFHENSNVTFDKDIYQSTVNKIAQKRAEFSEYEIKQKFALKATSYTTDAVFAAASSATGGIASIIVEPLKSMRNDAFDSAITATVENNNIQVGKVISLLAQSSSGQLLSDLKNFSGTPEQFNNLKASLIKSAEEKMNAKDAELFASQLNEEYLSSGITYAINDLKNINSTMGNIDRKLMEASLNLQGTKSKVDELAHSLKVLAESNVKFLNEQKELLKLVNANIAQNNSGINSSLVKLDFITQMTFGSMPAAMQLEYLKNSSHLIPLSEAEKTKLKSSLEFKVQAENAIQTISAFKTIGTNLDFLGRDGARVLDVSTVLLSSAISFMSATPMGYINGIASLSSLFAGKKQADPRLDLILENQRKTLEALRNINDNINSLRLEINESFKKINEEIFISRAVQLGNIRKDDLSACSLISEDFSKPASYFQLKEMLATEGRELHLSECLVNLTKFFSKPDFNNEDMTFTMNLSYRKNNSESTLINNYSNIYSALENENVPEILRTKFNLKTIIDPDMLNFYVVELLNNHHWYDITDSSRSGWSLVNFEKLTKTIENNKTSEKMLRNALSLIEANIYQHRIWSGLSNLDLFTEKYMAISSADSKNVSCTKDPSNVICIAIENPWFFNNLFNNVIQKSMTYDYLFSANLVAPNDPDYLNENMPGAFRFVWVGEGASSLYTGEIINDPKLVKTLGNGLFIKVATMDKINYYPLPMGDFIKKKISYELPKTSLLLKLKKIIQDEILDLNLKKVLNENEYKQTLQFYR